MQAAARAEATRSRTAYVRHRRGYGKSGSIRTKEGDFKPPYQTICRWPTWRMVGTSLPAMRRTAPEGSRMRGSVICSEALMIIGIHEYIAIFMKFRKIMGISRVS